jgi:hypothetical protein
MARNVHNSFLCRESAVRTLNIRPWLLKFAYEKFAC